MTWAGAAGHLDSLLPKQAWEQICKYPRVGQVFFGESVAGVGVGGTCQKLLLLGAAQAQSPRELPCDYTPRPQPPALNREMFGKGTFEASANPLKVRLLRARHLRKKEPNLRRSSPSMLASI